MTFRIRKVLTCDTPLCGESMFGNFTEHEAEVWSRAQEYGWERKIRRGNNRHYCPKCIQALADMDEVFKQDMNKG